MGRQTVYHSPQGHTKTVDYVTIGRMRSPSHELSLASGRKLPHAKVRGSGSDQKKALEEQLIEAEREGKPELVHKVPQPPSGRSGPKTRNHQAARRLQTCEHWRKELAAEGRIGGMSAVLCHF